MADGGSPWNLVYEGFDPEEEGLREALCVLGNGYFATRGAAPERRADGVHHPGTYIAGLYDRARTEVNGRTIENEDLVNAPNWLVLELYLPDGELVSAGFPGIVDQRVDLDIRRGVLTRTVVVEDASGQRTRLTQRRIVHMAQPHLAGLQTSIIAENWSGTVRIRSAIDGGVENTGVARYRTLESRHLGRIRRIGDGDGIVGLSAETIQSRIVVAMAMRSRVVGGDTVPHVAWSEFEEDRLVGHDLSVELRRGEPITVDKVVSVFTSRDRAIGSPDADAISWVARAPSFDELSKSHVLAWDQLWRRFHLRTGAGLDESRALNLHVFHLLQTVSKHTVDLDVGVPARGLHGEAYRGHIFWDELFIFPFINLHMPDLTRALLLYRYRRLPEARANAAAEGLDGALFPWQSGSSGREESQVVHLNPKSGRWMPDNSRLQRHVNIAIAYNVWRYLSVTGDRGFLASHGAELLVEISRLLSSLTSFDRALARYEIRRVMGPDEYHDGYPGAEEPGLDNNTYTNVMTVWVLRRTRQALEMLPEFRRRELWDELGIRREELELWEDITRRMRVVFHDGVMSQFEGYGDLVELDWTSYVERYGDIQRMDRILEAEGDTPNRYKLSKQADVLMLFYLLPAGELRDLLRKLGYDVDEGLVERTIDYYGSRTSHGSTLSRVVQAWILARSDRKASWDVFRSALMSDLADIQGGTTSEGIHLGAMAGTVDMVQRGYTGLEVTRDGVRLDPAIPPQLGWLECRLLVRGCWLDLRIDGKSISVTLEGGSPENVEIQVGENRVELHPGATHTVQLP